MADNSHPVLDGEVIVRPRNNTKNWEAKYKVSDGWRRTSTGTSDPKKAKEIALELYMEAKSLSERGIRVRTKGKLIVSFSDVAMMKRKQWIEDKKAGYGKPVYDSYINVVDRWLVPYFGNMPLLDVDDDVIEEFERHRRSELGREPSKSTINNHNCVFRAVFDLARRKKYIQSSQIPKFTLKGKGKQSKRRPAFDQKEIVLLEKKLLVWGENHTKSITRYKRKLLFFYVKLLLACGIRPSNEI